MIDIHPDGTLSALELILSEGRYRQIRRMMEFLGHPVRVATRAHKVIYAVMNPGDEHQAIRVWTDEIRSSETREVAHTEPC
jgi:16S rRNA U516 pseudouridylate synthase RsuA-like enzyme